jgi:class 3 adenylate cyclase
VLRCLIRHRGAIVSHNELLQEVWPNLHVTPDLVREYVFHLRRALGDNAQSPRYIETIRGRGFRLIGGVELASKADPAEVAEPLATADETDRGLVTTKLPVGNKDYKTVTALYCAISEVSTPIDRTASEAAHEAMEDFFACAQTVMERHEGTIVQWLEDGFLALFGAPLTYEDDARRAALAALDLNAALNGEGAATTSSLLGGRSTASMGLNTGPVVVGSLETMPSAPTYTARGLTVEVAKRLQSAAPAGAVLVSGSTYQALQSEISVSLHPTRDGSAPVIPIAWTIPAACRSAEALYREQRRFRRAQGGACHTA